MNVPAAHHPVRQLRPLDPDRPRVGRAFGEGGTFSFFLLWFLSIIGYFIVGYGDARFIGRGGRPDAIT